MSVYVFRVINSMYTYTYPIIVDIALQRIFSYRLLEEGWVHLSPNYSRFKKQIHMCLKIDLLKIKKSY